MRILPAALVAATTVLALTPGSIADSTTVIRLISTFSHARHVDRGPSGLGPGDVVVSSNRLANAVAQFGRPKGSVVGHDRGEFTLVTKTRMRLDGWTTLPTGRLHVRGRMHTFRRGRLVLSVVGGTGAFASALGSVTVTPYPDQVRNLVVYRLKLPS